MKKVMKSILYKVLGRDGYQKASLLYRVLFDKARPSFSGWGMETSTLPPWIQNSSPFNEEFIRINNQLILRVNSQKFNLSQFEDLSDKSALIGELMWRHFIVYWSTNYAFRATEGNSKNFVECGVCDGLAIFFALSSARESPFELGFYLYDAWEGMKEEYLLESEMSAAGQYSYLTQENAENNLFDFRDITIFNRGFIPDSFSYSVNPESLVWLHIDLNSSIPTKAALDFFFPKISKGGVILFDDYAWDDYAPTRIVIDEFFENKQGLLQHLPTGQALFFKL